MVRTKEPARKSTFGNDPAASAAAVPEAVTAPAATAPATPAPASAAAASAAAAAPAKEKKAPKEKHKEKAPKPLSPAMTAALSSQIDLDKVEKGGFSREQLCTLTLKEIKAVPSFVYHACLKKFPEDRNKAKDCCTKIMKKFTLAQKRELRNQGMFASMMG